MPGVNPAKLGAGGASEIPMKGSALLSVIADSIHEIISVPQVSQLLTVLCTSDSESWEITKSYSDIR
jgi:hypothetical protein